MANFPDITEELDIISKKLIVFANDEIKFSPKNKDGFLLKDYSIDSLEIPKDTMGIYFFEIKKNDKSQNFNEWIDQFKEKWNIDYVTNRPIIRKKSLNNLSEHSDEWIPFYIGKSKNIQYRVKQHITLGNTSTSALKLITMGNLNDETFRLSFLKIQTDHYDLVMPKIEEELRKKLNPIIGKQ